MGTANQIILEVSGLVSILKTPPVTSTAL